MKLTIEIPEYDGDGIDVIWHKGSSVHVRFEDDVVVIKANGEGLRSLGEQLLYLAQEDVQKGCHIHLDDFFCGDGLTGCGLLLEKE